MNLRHLSNEILLLNTSELAKRDREITLQVLHHLREVERRSLYATLAYPSLFEYVVKELKYSEGAAQRRISSMRLLKELPELEKKVESGALSLSSLAQAQVFFRQEKDQVKTSTDKREVIASLEHKSSREVERELVSRSSSPETLYKEKARAVSDQYTELKFLVDDKFLKEFEELKNLLAHSRPHATMKDILGLAVTKLVEKLRSKSPKEKSAKLPPAPAVKADSPNAKAHSRYVAREVERRVWQRDKGQCSYVDPISKRKCCSKHGLELDHIHPFALGGEATVENLRLRCRVHNQLAAINVFGEAKVARYVPRLG